MKQTETESVTLILASIRAQTEDVGTEWKQKERRTDHSNAEWESACDCYDCLSSAHQRPRCRPGYELAPHGHHDISLFLAKFYLYTCLHSSGRLNTSENHFHHLLRPID